jgi:hypothetical protein
MNNNQNTNTPLIDFIYDRAGAIIDGIYLFNGILLNVLMFCALTYGVFTGELGASLWLLVPVTGLFGMYMLRKKHKKRSAGIFGVMSYTIFLVIVNGTVETTIIFCVSAIVALLRFHIYLRNTGVQNIHNKQGE